MNYIKLLSCSVLALSLVAGTAHGASRRPAKEGETSAAATGGMKLKRARNSGIRTLRHKRHERIQRVRKSRKSSTRTTKTKKSPDAKMRNAHRAPRGKK